MHKYREASIVVASVLIYFVAALYWEAALLKIVIWWGKQLLLERPTMTETESFIYTIVAIIYTTVVIPQFVWFPVLFAQELLYLLKEESHAPYVSRAARGSSSRFGDGLRSAGRRLFHDHRTGRGRQPAC